MMSKALKKCQREDGFRNVSLHDPAHFGGKESSGTSLFVYGMAWGIRQGLLDIKEYLPVVIKSWNALVNDAVHPNGFLGYVRGTGKEPKDRQPVTYTNTPDFEDYGIGCFLLAGSEMYKLKTPH
jgi:rhamnogalacturonyl hydrolase YesR